MEQFNYQNYFKNYFIWRKKNFQNIFIYYLNMRKNNNNNNNKNETFIA